MPRGCSTKPGRVMNELRRTPHSNLNHFAFSLHLQERLCELHIGKVARTVGDRVQDPPTLHRSADFSSGSDSPRRKGNRMNISDGPVDETWFCVRYLSFRIHFPILTASFFALTCPFLFGMEPLLFVKRIQLNMNHVRMQFPFHHPFVSTRRVAVFSAYAVWCGS
jgi:hypothetical protein